MAGRPTFGTPAEHSGVFGAAEQRAADIHGADRAMFSVHGSTGSNWVVLRMLALERPDAHVLIARNVHHSVINALKAFGVSFSFLPTPYQRFEAFGPPNPADVRVGLAQHPEALAVLFTSPTYEGLGADTEAIAALVHAHSERALVLVDEAWGAHLAFHAELPVPAMHAGADVCVQSTHKLGGSLQQTGLILWREGRVDSALLEQAFAEYATTSPSFHLLASIEASLEQLLAVGESALETALRRTELMRRSLSARLPDLERFDREAGLLRKQSQATGADQTKTTLALSRYRLSGHDLSAALLDRGPVEGIVVEKAGLNTITLITTFQLPDSALEKAVEAIVAVLAADGARLEQPKPLLPNPLATLTDDPVIDPYTVCRKAKSAGCVVELDAAVGELAAEQIEVYPPGIPVILEGFPVTEGSIDYLRETAALGGSIIGRDPSLRTLRILQTGFTGPGERIPNLSRPINPLSH